jgi:hypothetical protein
MTGVRREDRCPADQKRVSDPRFFCVAMGIFVAVLVLLVGLGLGYLFAGWLTHR